MRVTVGGRTLAAAVVVTSLMLGASGARAQTATDDCTVLLVPGASRDASPYGAATMLVVGASDGGSLLCVQVAQMTAASLQGGENVYIRGFGFLTIAPLTPRVLAAASKADRPKLSRAEWWGRGRTAY